MPQTHAPLYTPPRHRGVVRLVPADLSVIILTLVTLVFVTLTPTRTAAQQTVIILDASSSMREDLGGETRLTVAKDAVRDVVDTIHTDAPDHPLGLVAFYDGCWVHAMETVAPVDANRHSILNHLNTLSTRKYGHTPIIRSLEVAARLLKGQPGDIILVSDGEETCDTGRDFCALAAELRDQNVDLKVHLIALSLTKEEQDAFLCLPQTTGGSIALASNQSELKEALDVAAEQTTRPDWNGCLDNRGGFLYHWCGE